jgi:Flp pilus assembly pilin Flp
MKKNGKNKIKKSFKHFMRDESGAMTKENVLKMGLTTIAALSMFSGMAKAVPPPCDGQYTHSSDNTLQWSGTDSGPKTIIPSHTHHTAHCSY